MSKINYQALREAAEKATPGRVGDRIDGSGSIKYECHGYDGSLVLRTDHKNMEYGFIGDNSNADELFFRLCVPDVILALLDELDKWQQESSAWQAVAEKHLALAEDAEKRIAELEAREIKPAKGEVLVVVSGFTGCGKSAIAGEIEIAMKAIGVPVKWTNGDAEKRMTGADWLTAIEMYKPTVRIVEVNVPRTAGIRIKGE
ncbi:TPA: ead/Ea22-like family protein [Escherichia coli]|uniref:ead/Ea22-like family protein n=1 Tax=Escherichia coli TaxID=562 RepID=UPI00175A9429|nr:ead/Ea22-like family protein [Escherichia coli]MCD5359090.1 ead/Ea22-like family protein [Escherichia coli]HAJ3911667.1 ead/Ea22-like family protein [Escherichia coli]HAJ3931549.1 ead/Ea22-like family protein [Escherichia coli]HAJ3940679.1 ead/Ea22-like family protein [Escherichia coli]HAJ3945946.1 ead/Ea22-like family protein [Escherichia coli]